MTKAVSYLRVSSVGAIEGDGFPRQRVAIQKYAQAHDIEILEEFRDEGVPGTTEMKNRAGLAACMARVETNGVKMVIVEGSDRLARDFMVGELIIREFQKMGVQVITASGGIDLTAGDNTNPTAKLVRQILAAVAEFDRCVIELKLRAARQRLRNKNGKCEGRKAYGSRPGEDVILKMIISWKKNGVPPQQMAAWLNAQRQTSRYGRQWHGATISKILARHDSCSTIAPDSPQVVD